MAIGVEATIFRSSSFRRTDQTPLRRPKTCTLHDRGSDVIIDIAPFEEEADLRTGDADIGERVVVERHQIAIGMLSPPPLGKSLPDRDKQVKK